MVSRCEAFMFVLKNGWYEVGATYTQTCQWILKTCLKASKNSRDRSQTFVWAWCKKIYPKIFGGPLQTSKTSRAPLSAMKIMGQPIEQHVKLYVLWVVIFSSPPPPCGSNILTLPLLVSGPQVFVNRPQVTYRFDPCMWTGNWFLIHKSIIWTCEPRPLFLWQRSNFLCNIKKLGLARTNQGNLKVPECGQNCVQYPPVLVGHAFLHFTLYHLYRNRQVLQNFMNIIERCNFNRGLA